ncbi:MAG: helix-turn-helix domain-containing protein [Lachnospiraceae bacterium]|nr:helix-turn-helix domain-containing protein [Lachnospiraceae bacterium]
MQINIGERIKELRKRDGRKQSDLADAIGVSNQAVSRWESGGSYPDMELIPSIAHYFNVSVDDLFGYCGERESAISRILAEADDSLKKNSDQTKCIEMLRAAADEYPAEPMILVTLARALYIQGRMNNKSSIDFDEPVVRIEEDSSHSYFFNNRGRIKVDTVHAAQNPYWQEMIRIAEKALKFDLPVKDRDCTVGRLNAVFGEIGEHEKGYALAQKQSTLGVSRELLLAYCANSETANKYEGEAIIALLEQLCEIVLSSFSKKVTVYFMGIVAGFNPLPDFAHFIESVFYDGRMGIFHYYLCTIFFVSAVISSGNTLKNEDPEGAEALKYFEAAVDHYNKYQAIPHNEDYHYTAPLVVEAVSPAEDFIEFPDDFWQTKLQIVPEEVKQILSKSPLYDSIKDL